MSTTMFLYVALAAFSRSPSAYEALKSYNLLQLPSATTLKAYKSPLIDSPGEIDEKLMKERKLYDGRVKEATQRQKMNKDFPIPLSKGVLIFDEVNVAMKIHWNSRDDTLIGYAMTRDEMSSLRDVYELLDDNFK